MSADSNAELMTAYLDDALEEGEAESFEQFLEDSPEARREVEELQQMLSLVRELPEVEAPPDFYDNLAKKVRKRHDDGTSMSLMSLPFQIISVLVIMVIAATYLMLEIERENAQLEKDPSAAKQGEQSGEQRDDPRSRAP